MMYAFGNRADTYATDEPLYAHYLATTGVAHPGAEEVIARGETDWRAVVSHLAGDPPDGSAVWYQKHMCHHIFKEMNLSWAKEMRHCFLLRDPREVLLSLANKTDAIDAHATGLPHQSWLVAELHRLTGEVPLLVDSRDILLNPEAMLTRICVHLGLSFDEDMLRWEAGPKSCDGIWAPHWYDAVWASTGFAPYRRREGTLTPALAEVLEEVKPLYDRLYAARLQR